MSKMAKTAKALGRSLFNESEVQDMFDSEEAETSEEKKTDAKPVECFGQTIPNDEDILALSDPPYYTVCPNPFIADFIKHYGNPYDSSKPYIREPFATDLSEGKNDPIYKAHSYHTKVPHKAIMRYILHYTEPGDVVLDGFCGTGMTGVASRLCENKQTILSLGYRVGSDGTILDSKNNRISNIRS